MAAYYIVDVDKSVDLLVCVQLQTSIVYPPKGVANCCFMGVCE